MTAWWQAVRRRPSGSAGTSRGSVAQAATATGQRGRNRHSPALGVPDAAGADAIESTVAETVLRTFKLSYDWARELLGPGADQIASPPSLHDEQPHMLGPADTAIVAALSADARRPFAAVAEETGIHERTVRRRFEALRHRGCVNVATFVPGQALGFQPEMVIRVDVSPAHLHEAAGLLARHRGVRYLAVTLGQVGLFGEVYLPSLDAVYRFTTEDIGSLPGVTGMQFTTELLTLKRGYVPLPASAALHGAWAPSDRSSSANCPRFRRSPAAPSTPRPGAPCSTAASWRSTSSPASSSAEDRCGII